MTVFSNFIPLIGSFLSGFAPILYFCLAFAVVMASPKIIWSVFDYV